MKAPPDRDPDQVYRNVELLSPGLRAPLILTPNTPLVFRGAFRSFLQQGSAPKEVLDLAVSVGGNLMYTFQEIVLSCNRLITQPAEQLADVVRTLILYCRELLGARNVAYALDQAVERLTESDRLERPAQFDRLKNLMEPLERRLDELGLPRSMDMDRFGILQVQLDEIYDHASLQLQRLYLVLNQLKRREEQSTRHFCIFARSLSSAVTREIIPDQILGSGAGPGRERTGLLDLLPEFENEFK